MSMRNDPEGREARLGLASAFWYPAYAYLRAEGFGPQAAHDRLQALLADFVETPPTQALPRFREFLLLAVKNAAMSGVDGPALIKIDLAWAESRFDREPVLPATGVFVRRWVLTLLEFTLAQVEEEYVAAGKGERYLAMLPFLGYQGGDLEDYDALAARIGKTAHQARVSVYELRKFYRATLQAQLGQTVLEAEDIKAETTAMQLALA